MCHEAFEQSGSNRRLWVPSQDPCHQHLFAGLPFGKPDGQAQVPGNALSLNALSAFAWCRRSDKFRLERFLSCRQNLLERTAGSVENVAAPTVQAMEFDKILGYVCRELS